MTHSIFDSFDSVALRAAIAYRYCTIKSHKEKDDVGSTNSRRGYSMSLLRQFVTSDSAILVVPSQKKNFQFWVWGSLGGALQVGVFSHFKG